MAKMFYTLAEAQEKLGMNEDEIKQLAREGRLREFRDGPRLMFKADQVEQLRSERYVPPLDLSDSGASLSLDDSDFGSGSGLLALTQESDDTSIGNALLGNDPDDTALGMKLLDEIAPPKRPMKKPTKKASWDDVESRKKAFDEKPHNKGDWAPKPSLGWRIFKALVLLAIGFAAGFATCFALSS